MILPKHPVEHVVGLFEILTLHSYSAEFHKVPFNKLIPEISIRYEKSMTVSECLLRRTEECRATVNHPPIVLTERLVSRLWPVDPLVFTLEVFCEIILVLSNVHLL